MPSAGLAALVALAAWALPVSAQEGASLGGWVYDAASGEPVSGILVRLQPPTRRSVTDIDGRFRFTDLAQGAYALSVDDPAFGAHTDVVEVPVSGVVELIVRLGPSFFELEPLVVDVLRAEEAARRAMGSPSYRITREEIEASLGGGLSPGDILRRRVPGITIDPGLSFGVPGCVEFRRPTSFFPGCQPPLVIVDGVRISAATSFLDAMPLEHIESLTVLSPTEAATLYGLGAANGVIEVRTLATGTGPRRPPAGPTRPEGGSGAPTPAAETWKSAYNWAREPAGHPWLRSWGGATVGMLAGLAVSIAATGDCSPLNEHRSLECSGGGGWAGAATFALPVMGGALGANLGGRTGQSRGKILMTGLAALMPMFAGYFFAVPDNAVAFESEKVLGRTIVLVGLPVFAAAADRVFRTGR